MDNPPTPDLFQELLLQLDGAEIKNEELQNLLQGDIPDVELPWMGDALNQPQAAQQMQWEQSQQIPSQQYPLNIQQGYPDVSQDIKPLIMMNQQNPVEQQQIQQMIPRHITNKNSLPPMPYIEIVENVHSEKLRFRYASEGRSVSIAGISSTPDNKTFPGVKIVGYQGNAVVVASCVTEEEPYRPHPHELTERDASTCKDGVVTKKVPTDTMTVYFQVGVQCVLISHIKKSLEKRERIRVDPFKTGFEHKNKSKKINLGAIRLCFQAFICHPVTNELKVPLQPVVSNVIYDTKSHGDLHICKISHYSCPCSGNVEMILLCEKVLRTDIDIVFYEEKDGKIYWEKKAIFKPNDVHRQSAISFKTPPYKDQDINQPVQVYMQLRRPSDDSVSDPRPFQYLPLGTGDPDSLKRKRRKYSNNPKSFLLEQLQAEAKKKTLNPSLLAGLNFPKPEPRNPNYNPFSKENLPSLLPVQTPNLNPISVNMNNFRTDRSSYQSFNSATNIIKNSEDPTESIKNIAKQLAEPDNIPPCVFASNLYNEPPQTDKNIFKEMNNFTPNYFPNAIQTQQEQIKLDETSNLNPLVNAIADVAEIPTTVGCISAEMQEPVIQTDDLPFEQFKNKLSLSDLVREAIAGEETEAELEEKNETDSLTKLTRQIIEDVSNLTDMYG